MSKPVSRVVIVGGGTAGWLSACLVAAHARRTTGARLEVTLVESPDVPTIGVGEGTWPTLRGTLERIGLAEDRFLLACDASFKQGSRFDGWVDGAADDRYYHPFVGPPTGEPRDLVSAWRETAPAMSFADAVSAQPRVCQLDLSPRQPAMPGYAGALNYAYHLDAGKLAHLLAEHGTGQLGVRHVRDHVDEVVMGDEGDVLAVRTRGSGLIQGDLFIDCTGHAALLIGGAFGVPLRDRSTELFNDRALAVQVPVDSASAIVSQTVATAHAAGWLWDIGLPTRRGIGCVYSSSHASDDAAAATLLAYVERTVPEADRAVLPIRRLTFRSGHRERFWVRNCLAVGLSAGFLEPLEASAIVLIELSLGTLLDNFPAATDAMNLHARRFNELFLYRWDRIVEFLKLHYVLSKRQEPYWRDHRSAASIPSNLADLLRLWQDQPPSSYDLPHASEIFPAASYQYVLYGMGFPPPCHAGPASPSMVNALKQAHQRARVLASSLPTNRGYLDALRTASGTSISFEHMH